MATHLKANDKRKLNRKMANAHSELILPKSDEKISQTLAKVVANKGSQFEVMFFENGEMKNANARKEKIKVGDVVLICWDCAKGAKEQYYIACKYTDSQVKQLEKLGQIKSAEREDEDEEDKSGFTFSKTVEVAQEKQDTSWIDDI